MGKFKDEGNAAHALSEECSEVIQVINKMYRFYGDWDEIPDGKEQTRWEELVGEMEDVIYQWNRLVLDRNQHTTDNGPLSQENWELIIQMNKK